MFTDKKKKKKNTECEKNKTCFPHVLRSQRLVQRSYLTQRKRWWRSWKWDPGCNKLGLSFKTVLETFTTEVIWQQRDAAQQSSPDCNVHGKRSPPPIRPLSLYKITVQRVQRSEVRGRGRESRSSAVFWVQSVLSVSSSTVTFFFLFCCFMTTTTTNTRGTTDRRQQALHLQHV